MNRHLPPLCLTTDHRDREDDGAKDCLLLSYFHGEWSCSLFNKTIKEENFFTQEYPYEWGIVKRLPICLERFVDGQVKVNFEVQHE